MKKGFRRAVFMLLVVCFLGSGAFVLRQLWQYQVAAEVNKAAKELVEPVDTAVLPETEAPLVQLPEAEPAEPAEPGEPEPPVQEPLAEEAGFLLDLDLDVLRETNEMVLGWIHIPDSEISYPLLEVEDNQQYLRRAWDGTPNNAGCIFLECRNDPGFSDFNTLIYGHYMRNGTMFGSLHEYKDQEYTDSHPAIYIVTEEGIRRYEVFAAYEADVVSNTYRLYFEDDTRKQSALDEYMEQTVIQTEYVPTIEDHILTLSTCTGTGTYDTRWVVQAVLTGEFFEHEKAEP